MKKIFTILCLMALTMGAQAQAISSWTTELTPVTKDALVASAGSGERYVFRMPSWTTPGWCDFVNRPAYASTKQPLTNTTYYYSVTDAYLFTIESSSTAGKYKLKRDADGKFLSGNAQFNDTGMDLTLTNRAPTGVNDFDDGMGYSTNYVSFDNANGAHYNCGNDQGGLQFRGGAGGWSVYAAYGPIYKNITIDCKEGNVSMSGYPLQSDYRIGGTFEAPVFPGKRLANGEPTSVTIDQDNMSITFNYEASTFDYTFVVNNAPEGITITIKGDEVSASASNVSFDEAVTVSDVVVTFPTGYEHYSYTATISGTTITVNCKAMTAVTDLSNLTDGYYLVEGKAKDGTGYFFHDKSLANRFYRISTNTTIDLDAAQYNNETNFKYVWILKNNGNGSFTLRNCGTLNYLPADTQKNKNCEGTETANLVWDIENQWMYQTNYKDGVTSLYMHVNGNLGDPVNLSYWPGNDTPGGSGSLVAPVFYKVQLSDEAVAQIVANRKEDLSAILTTLSSLPTGEGLNKYTVTEAGTNAITEASAVNNNEDATLEEVDAAIKLLENLGDAFSLNMPQDKTFLRIRSTLSDQAYLKAADAGATMTFSTTADASTIFCYIDGKLVAYNNGLAANNVCNMGVAGGAASKFTFVEGLNGTPVTYSLYESEGTITDGSVYLYSRENGGNADRGPLSQTGWYNNFTFTLEEVPTLPITLRTTDNTNYFATFSAPVAVRIEGATLCSVEVSESGKSINYTATENTQLAADHGVLLHATGSGEATIEATATILTETEATDTYGLEGYSAAFTVAEAEQTSKLFLGKGSQSGKAGFYKLGSAKTNGFKAYLSNSTELGGAKEGLELEFAGVTGIENMEHGTLNMENGAVYNLQGQRVNKAQKGVYIINNKKVVVK